MRGLNRLVYSGQILYPAVSDTPAWLVVKANDFARNNGLSPFVLYQGMFSLLRRDLEREVIRASPPHLSVVARSLTLTFGQQCALTRAWDSLRGA